MSSTRRPEWAIEAWASSTSREAIASAARGFGATIRTEAAIEKARSDAAVLRSQANSARMIAQNPALMKLRALDSLDRASEGYSNTVVFKLGTDSESNDTGKDEA